MEGDDKVPEEYEAKMLLFHEQIKRDRLPSFSLAVIKQGKTFTPIPVESLDPGTPSAAHVGRKLSAAIYLFLGRTKVVEYLKRGAQYMEEEIDVLLELPLYPLESFELDPRTVLLLPLEQRLSFLCYPIHSFSPVIYTIPLSEAKETDRDRRNKTITVYGHYFPFSVEPCYRSLVLACRSLIGSYKFYHYPICKKHIDAAILSAILLSALNAIPQASNALLGSNVIIRTCGVLPHIKTVTFASHYQAILDKLNNLSRLLGFGDCKDQVLPELPPNTLFHGPMFYLLLRTIESFEHRKQLTALPSVADYVEMVTALIEQKEIVITYLSPNQSTSWDSLKHLVAHHLRQSLESIKQAVYEIFCDTPTMPLALPTTAFPPPPVPQALPFPAFSPPGSATALAVPLALPVDMHEGAIIKQVRSQQVTVIQGDTGCGKSSRVPRMILKICIYLFYF